LQEGLFGLNNLRAQTKLNAANILFINEMRHKASFKKNEIMA